jgi:hypothetical protein
VGRLLHAVPVDPEFADGAAEQPSGPPVQGLELVDGFPAGHLDGFVVDAGGADQGGWHPGEVAQAVTDDPDGALNDGAGPGGPNLAGTLGKFDLVIDGAPPQRGEGSRVGQPVSDPQFVFPDRHDMHYLGLQFGHVRSQGHRRVDGSA